MEGLHQRSRTRLADRTALVGAATADLVLDGVKGTDPCESLAGDRRIAAFGDVVEAPAEVREPMSDRKIGAHASRSAGRSRAWSITAFDVPPRIKIAGSFFWGMWRSRAGL
jgi:hypothetical protein